MTIPSPLSGPLGDNSESSTPNRQSADTEFLRGDDSRTRTDEDKKIIAGLVTTSSTTETAKQLPLIDRSIESDISRFHNSMSTNSDNEEWTAPNYSSSSSNNNNNNNNNEQQSHQRNTNSHSKRNPGTGNFHVDVIDQNNGKNGDDMMMRDEPSLDAEDYENYQYQQQQRYCSLMSDAVRWVRNGAGRIVEDERFQYFIVVLIVVNAIMMGLATFNFVSESERVSAAFEQTDQVFLILFTVELGLQFLHRGFRLFVDGWLLFDFVIVLMSWSLDSIQIVRTFRIFRALRMVTRVALLRNLVLSLFAVMPRMTALNLLLSLVFYVFGVMCTILFGDLYERGLTDEDYFSRLDISCWTLFVMMTLDWAEVARQVLNVYPLSWPIFVLFVFLSSFIGYNLMIAIVCDSVNVIDRIQKDLAKKRREKNRANGENVDDDDDSEREAREAEEHREMLKAQHSAKVAELQERVYVLQTRQEKILSLMKIAVQELQRQ